MDSSPDRCTGLDTAVLCVVLKTTHTQINRGKQEKTAGASVAGRHINWGSIRHEGKESPLLL